MQSVPGDGSSKSPSTWPSLVLVGVALLFGAFVRLHGIGFLLPYGIESDGKILPAQVDHVRAPAHAPPPDEWRFYPHLVAYFSAALPSSPRRAEPTAPLDDHLAAARAPIEDARRAVALLSLLSIPATWLLARCFVGRTASFVAAMGVASSLLSVWFAQEARPHAPAAGFVVLALWGAVMLRRSPTTARHLAAGLACGLAIAALQSGVVVLGALCAAHVLRERGLPKTRLRANLDLVLALAAVAAVGALFYPRTELGAQPAEIAQIGHRGTSFEFYGHSVFLGLFRGGGFRTVADTLWIFEPQWVVLGALALVPRRRRTHESTHPSAQRASRRRDVWVLCAYAIPYTLAIGLYDRTFERFVLPLVPLLAVAGASAVQRGLDALRAMRMRARTVLASALVIALVAGPAASAVVLARVRASEDTPSLAARWIREHLDPNEDRVLFVPYLDLPLLRNARALAQGTRTGWATPWRAYQQGFTPPLASDAGFELHDLSRASAEARESLQRDPVGHFRALGMRYVAIALPHYPGDDSTFGHYHRALRAGAERVCRIAACEDDAHGDVALWFEYGARPYPAPLAWLLASSFTAAGPVIEIYRLPSEVGGGNR